MLGKGVGNGSELANDGGVLGKAYLMNCRCGGPGNLVAVGVLFEGVDHKFVEFGLGRMKEWGTEVLTEDRDTSNESVEITFDKPVRIDLVHELVNR